MLSLDFGGRYEAQIASFELSGNSQEAQRFNAARRRALHGEEQTVFECSRDVAGSSGSDAEYNSREQPKLITDHWVMIEQSVESYCGGAHPNADSIATTWRLDSGKTADVWSWFVPAAAVVERHGQGANRRRRVGGRLDGVPDRPGPGFPAVPRSKTCRRADVHGAVSASTAGMYTSRALANRSVVFTEVTSVVPSAGIRYIIEA
jgi:hypothetical protein